MYTFPGCDKNFFQDTVYCEDTASISNDWNNSMQEVQDSEPVIILIIFFCI